MNLTGVVDMSDNPYPGADSRIVALPNDEVAILFNNAIHIFKATQYAAAVPVIFETFCGGPVLDDFSDVNSGWPSDNLGDVIIGYIDDEYTIMHQNADAWFAVSRGDPWINGQLANISTRLPAQDGSSGLVFGLNNDWSHFYTFEVVPASGPYMGYWIVLDYTAGIGWTLVDANPHASITGIGGWNRLELNSGGSTDSIALVVNGNMVGAVGNVSGRIGLSAGSFGPGFVARFDDYGFLGQNCTMPGRAAEIDVAPVIARPPLESFLNK